MRIKTILVLVMILIIPLSGCIDSRVHGTYRNEKDNSTLKFMDDGTVLALGKNDNGENTSTVENYKIDGDNVIISVMAWAFIYKIEDNGDTLVSSTDGSIFKRVSS